MAAATTAAAATTTAASTAGAATDGTAAARATVHCDVPREARRGRDRNLVDRRRRLNGDGLFRLPIAVRHDFLTERRPKRRPGVKTVFRLNRVFTEANSRPHFKRLAVCEVVAQRWRWQRRSSGQQRARNTTFCKSS